jgi:hypothetical protein
MTAQRKVALVTGASSGLGVALAQELAVKSQEVVHPEGCQAAIAKLQPRTPQDEQPTSWCPSHGLQSRADRRPRLVWPERSGGRGRLRGIASHGAQVAGPVPRGRSSGAFKPRKRARPRCGAVAAGDGRADPAPAPEPADDGGGDSHEAGTGPLHRGALARA